MAEKPEQISMDPDMLKRADIKPNNDGIRLASYSIDQVSIGLLNSPLDCGSADMAGYSAPKIGYTYYGNVSIGCAGWYAYIRYQYKLPIA